MFDSIITQNSVVLSGSGPTMHIKADSPSTMLVVTKRKVQSLPLSNHTNVKFAA